MTSLSMCTSVSAFDLPRLWPFAHFSSFSPVREQMHRALAHVHALLLFKRELWPSQILRGTHHLTLQFGACTQPCVGSSIPTYVCIRRSYCARACMVACVHMGACYFASVKPCICFYSYMCTHTYVNTYNHTCTHTHTQRAYAWKCRR